MDSITLAPAGPAEVTFDDAMQTIGESIAPGEVRDFEMFVTIDVRGRPATQFMPSIDSVDVTVACRSEGGDFVDSRMVSVQRR